MLHLDHVVHVVRDLEGVRDQLTGLGFHVIPGGVHPGWGTRNALAYFDLTYIELVAVRDPAEAASSHFGGQVLRFAQTGEGLGTAALATDDLDAAVATMRGRGVAVAGPFDGSRRRPDGSMVAWRLAFPPWPWPFLIQWAEVPERRRADLTARGAIQPHGITFDRVGWAVSDLDRAAGYLEQAYGMVVGEAYLDLELGSLCRQSDGGLLLCQPTGPGPAQDRLERHGDGPFLCDLTGAVDTRRIFPPEEACGSWIRLRALQ